MALVRSIVCWMSFSERLAPEAWAAQTTSFIRSRIMVSLEGVEIRSLVWQFRTTVMPLKGIFQRAFFQRASAYFTTAVSIWASRKSDTRPLKAAESETL